MSELGDGWVRVSDKLPDYDDPVLVIDVNRMDVATCGAMGAWRDNNGKPLRTPVFWHDIPRMSEEIYNTVCDY